MQVSHADAKRYDRQIRLWGLEGQRRIQQSRVLFIRPRGLMTEVIKNVVLAGVNVMLWDDARLSIDAFPPPGCDFFLTAPSRDNEWRVENMQPQVQALNPHVHVETKVDPVHADTIQGFLSDPSGEFSVVCFTHEHWALTLAVAAYCHQNHVKWYVAGCDGLDAWIFCDVGKHVFMPPGKSKPQEAVWLSMVDAFQKHTDQLQQEGMSLKMIQRTYPPVFLRLLLHFMLHQAQSDPLFATLEDRLLLVPNRPADWAARLLPDAYITAWTPREDISPVCAIVGGILAQDMIHVIAGSHRPISSFFIFDGRTFSGILV